VWNCLIFFVGEYWSVWPEICRVLSQIQWRFLGGISGKNSSGRIFQKFCANQGYPLPKLVKFRPNICNFIMGLYCDEKISHKHFRMLFPPRQGGTSINESQKEDTGKKSQDVLFLKNRFCSLSVWDLLRLTPLVFSSEIFTRHSSLCLLSFGWGLSPRFVPQHWQSIFDSSLPELKGSFVCVWNCLIFFVGEYSSVWPEICRVLSQIQWRFLSGIFEKNYSGRIFQKFCANQGYPLPKLLKFRPNICNFILGSYCDEKISQKHFRMLFAPRQGGTSINESQKKDTGKKSQDIFFSENRFCLVSVWDLLRLTPLIFWSEILPDIRHCIYWILADVWAPDSSHKIYNQFLIHHCQGWKKGLFVFETVWFFSRVNTHLFDLKFVAFCPKFSGDSRVEF